MDYKTWLVDGYCPVDSYTCLMPVEYESEGTDGLVTHYHKKRMICRHVLSGECSKGNECTFFQDAPKLLDKSENWYQG